jgi:4-amino-4-deoxy-L-arabinose transferase-like glycosyltransferase
MDDDQACKLVEEADGRTPFRGAKGDSPSVACSAWLRLFTRRSLLEGIGLILILLGAGGLRLWGIERNGYGNQYYAAAVRSALTSATNFLFGSFDPAGFVTVDKPPGALWIQAASAEVFGFSGPSLLVPQAVMGVASVIVVYLLVRRLAGPVAALVAGLILAITPVSVAVDRDNLPDTALVFVLLLAAWALTRALETGRLRPLLAAAALVGVGFNVKMLAAFVVLPAFYLTYLVAGSERWWRRLGRLAAATGVVLAVSLSWAIVVELTPPDRRPYIGGSKHNSAFELALGYNGLGRIFGGAGNFRPGGRWPRRADDNPAANNPASDPRRTTPDEAGTQNGQEGQAPFPPDNPGGDFPPFPPDPAEGAVPPGDSGPGFFPNGPGGTDNAGASVGFGPGFTGGSGGPGRPGGGQRGGFGGAPGALRFASPQMAGQITWLFPFALIGAASAASRAGWRPPDMVIASLVLWCGWLITHWAVFSWAQGIFHEYYTTIMGPALAALAGIGVAALWREWFHRRGWRGFLLPLALAATAAWQGFIVTRYPEVRRWLLPALLAGVGVGAVGVVAGKLLARRPKASGWCRLVAGVGLSALLIGPTWWSLTCLLRPSMGGMPAANPMAFAGRPRGGPDANSVAFIGRPGGVPPFARGPFGADPRATTRLVEFLRANRHGERILVAAQGSREVAPIIIATGEPAVALGGFMGADPILSAEDFARLVQEGQVRFVLAGARGRGPRGMALFGPGGPPSGQPAGPGSWAGGPPGGPPGGPGNSELMEWVRKHGKEVDPHLWRLEEPAQNPDTAEADGRWRFFGPQGRQRLYDCRPELGLVSPKVQTEG